MLSYRKKKGESMDIRAFIQQKLEEAFSKCGYHITPQVIFSARPEISDFQSNNIFQVAKENHLNPIELGKQISDNIDTSHGLFTVTFLPPAFINFSLTDKGLSNVANSLNSDENVGVNTHSHNDTVLIDYGGANVAKELHIGHLRSSIIGESLARLNRLLGNKVISDTHLGDWGLQMGLVVAQLEDEGYVEGYFGRGENKPISMDTLNSVYPKANIRKKTEPEFKQKAEQYTLNIQQQKEPYYSVYKFVKELSVKDIKRIYDELGCNFDLWYGESDAEPYIPRVVQIMKDKGLAVESEGALIVNVANSDENIPTNKLDENGNVLLKNPMPPLILKKHNGADVYATSEIGTILMRNEMFNPDRIIYLTDKRQDTHFKQVFRACKMSGISPEKQELVHIAFGTINGSDGKPFKTRSGDVVKLQTIIELVTEKATEKLAQNGIVGDEKLAKQIGICAMKFGDLSNFVSKDYIFDADKFTAFEGKTGPYIQYTAVRIKSILNKAGYNETGEIDIHLSEEKKIIIQILKFIDSLEIAYNDNSVNSICMSLYDLCASYSNFYNNVRILSEADANKKQSYLNLSALTFKAITIGANVLGIEIPDKM